jgi:hypothetical protein
MIDTPMTPEPESQVPAETTSQAMYSLDDVKSMFGVFQEMQGPRESVEPPPPQKKSGGLGGLGGMFPGFGLKMLMGQGEESGLGGLMPGFGLQALMGQGGEDGGSGFPMLGGALGTAMGDDSFNDFAASGGLGIAPMLMAKQKQKRIEEEQAQVEAQKEVMPSAIKDY